MVASDWFLLGAPWDCSGSRRGEQAAPGALRRAGLPALVGGDLGDAATVVDRAGRDEQTGVLALRKTVQAADALADTLAGALRDLPGRRPVVVGGDCSILLGVFPALRRRVGTAGLWFVDDKPLRVGGYNLRDGGVDEAGDRRWRAQLDILDALRLDVLAVQEATHWDRDDFARLHATADALRMQPLFAPSRSHGYSVRPVGRGDAVGVIGRPLDQLDPVAVRVGDPRRSKVVRAIR